MASEDHHSAYLARAVAALEPDGRARVVGFAAARRAEVAAGRVDPEPSNGLTEQELDVLLGGFLRIRDQEPRDDVSDWANAVVALLEDGLNELQKERRG